LGYSFQSFSKILRSYQMSDNNKSYVWTLLPAQNPDGNYIMSAIVKRTYDIDDNGNCKPSEKQDGLISADIYYDGKDPVTASCLMESDYIPYKVATDVVVIGKAYAPKGIPVQSLFASVSVNGQTKRVIIFGNRKCSYSLLRGLKFSEPEPFTEMEIRYENAYGGVDLDSFGPDQPMIYPRNFIGKGFIVKNIKEGLDKLELPNIEDPDYLLTPDNIITEKMENWQTQPMPQGFGWYGKLWYPRCSYAGVLPAYMSLYKEILEAASGLVPKDQVEQFKKFKLPMLDFKFFNGASPGLIFPFLKGGEVISLVNMSPHGNIDIKLPDVKLKIGIDIGKGMQYPEVVLQTVCILKEQNRLYLVWRGAIDSPGPDKMTEITKMDVVIEEG